MKLARLAEDVQDELNAIHAIGEYLEQHGISNQSVGRTLTIRPMHCVIKIFTLGTNAVLSTWKTREESARAPKYTINLHSPDSFPKILNFVKTHMRHG